MPARQHALPVSRCYLTTAGSARPPAERSSTCPCQQPVTHSFTSWSAQRLMGMLLRHSRELKVTPWCSHSSCAHGRRGQQRWGLQHSNTAAVHYKRSGKLTSCSKAPLGKGNLVVWCVGPSNRCEQQRRRRCQQAGGSPAVACGSICPTAERASCLSTAAPAVTTQPPACL